VAKFKPIKVKAERAAAVGAKFGRTKGKLSSELEQSVSDIGQAMKRVYRFWTPKQSGRMQKGIGVRKAGRAVVEITVSAVDPDTGFNYVAVSRFGHRVTTIQPVTANILKLNLYGGFWTFAPEVKGYRPKYDWVEEAFYSAQEVAETHAHKLSQRLDLRLAS